MSQEQSSSSLEKFLFGTLIGSLLGGLLGLLLAPRSGEETRRLINEGAKTKYDETSKVVTEGVDQSVCVVKEKVGASVSQLQDVTGKLKVRAEEISGRLAQAGQQALETLKTGKANGESTVSDTVAEFADQAEQATAHHD
jgi:gas vesicle protein